MRQYAIWGLLFLLAACTSSTQTAAASLQQNEARLDHAMVVKPIAENTFVVTDTEYRDSNVLVARMPDNSGVILSSPFESVGTETLLSWIHKKWSPHEIVAINTHFHMDGTGGNEAFKKRGVETWAGDLTRSLQVSKLHQLIESAALGYTRQDLKDRLLKSRVVVADHIFPSAQGKIFDIGGERVEVFYPGPAHTADNLVVYFPKRKILFGGCMIKPKQLGYLGDAVVKSWADSARNLKRFDAEIVVPGHGPWGGPELVDQTIATAAAAAAQGAAEK